MRWFSCWRCGVTCEVAEQHDDSYCPRCSPTRGPISSPCKADALIRQLGAKAPARSPLEQRAQVLADMVNDLAGKKRSLEAHVLRLKVGACAVALLSLALSWVAYETGRQRGARSGFERAFSHEHYVQRFACGCPEADFILAKYATGWELTSSVDSAGVTTLRMRRR